MKFYFFCLIACLITLPLSAQVYRANVNEDFTISVDTLPGEITTNSRAGGFTQLTGFPKGTTANASFKNFRNVTLVDLNNDGVEDILFAANDQLFAYANGTLLWQKKLNGIAIYPPSVADLNQDGQPEIVQTTGGVPANGRVYLLDQNGNDFPGWPLNFNNNWMLTAAALADVDNDQMMEIIVCERSTPGGKVHLLKIDGNELNSNWPVTLPATPAVTPSVGDLDNDGDKEVVIHSTKGRYVFDLDGQITTGFPQLTDPNQRYSYQSPILVDLDGNNTLEIVGATHGDQPEFYVLTADGSELPGWPIAVPDDSWTYNPPTVVKIQEEYIIFNSRPIGEAIDGMLYAWDKEGNLRSGFPIEKSGGLEGFISVADVDNDGAFEIVFPANVLDDDGFGFIHAYEIDGSGQVPGFPIRTKGWTFMNGATIGDVNGDEMMDLAVLSYTQNFGASPDSIFLNVFELKVPYDSGRVLWGTYKGHNSRDGLIRTSPTVGIDNSTANILNTNLSPNPVSDLLHIELNTPGFNNCTIEIHNAWGQKVKNIQVRSIPSGSFQKTINLENLTAGNYWLSVFDDQIKHQTLPFKILR